MRRGWRSAWLMAFVAGLASGACAQDAALKLTTPKIPDDLTGTLRTINERLSKDLAPADNIVVDLVRIYGSEVFERPLRRMSLEMLGIDRVPNGGAQFLYLEPYVVAQGAVGPEEQARAAGNLMFQVKEAQQQPWERREYPELAEYLTANEKPLDIVLAAVEKSRFYAPILSEEEPPRLLAASYVIERRLQFLVDCLSARAMQEVGEGNVSVGRMQLLACQKLAVRLATDSPFDMSGAKADVLDAIAFRASIGALQSGKVTGPIAKEWLTLLDAIPRLPSPSQAADIGERAVIHQEIEFLQTDEESVAGFLELSDQADREAVKGLKLTDIDWKEAHRRADELQDQIVKALAIRDRQQQFRQFEQLDKEQAAWEMVESAKFLELEKLIKDDPKAAGRIVGEAMARSLRPNYWQRRHSEDRGRVRRDLQSVGLALVAYKGEHGGYPTTLADLVPRFLKTEPVEAHSDRPFGYRRSATDHARVVSFGANQMDDAGQTYNDDLAIELH